MTSRRWFWAIVLVSAVLRLLTYCSRPSLSYDETMLALNVATRSFAGLLAPLDYHQTAPALYLWFVKLAVLIGGVGDLALRLPSLLAGLAVPVVGWRVARRLMPDPAARFVAGVLALAPGLAQYSSIVKPYEVDALVTLVILDLTLVWQDEAEHAARWWALAAAGGVAVCLSSTAVLVLAGAGLAMLLHGHRVRASGVIAAWVASFAVAYFAFYRATATGGYMQTYWAADFLTPATYALDGRAWGVLSHSFVEALVLRPVPTAVALGATALFLIGLGRIKRARGWSGVALLAGPIGATILASLVRRYPFNWRLLLFAVPLAVLLLGGTLAWGLDERRAAVRRAVVVAAAVVLFALLSVDVSHPYRTAPVRQLVDTAAARPRGEPIYIFSGAIPAWGLYATDWRAPDRPGLDSLAAWVDGAPTDAVLGGSAVIGRPSGTSWRVGVGVTKPHPDSGWADHEVDRLARAAGPEGRAWLLFTQVYGSEIQDVRGTLARAGAREISADGARGAMLLHVSFPRSGS
ncbi:MAG TPA: glycosyltransferase family 39 protein [Gemmatimonadales bacterium]|nr:glycosyltransferase family 39 protein [Gemmatimonadales bacterium]